MDVKPFKERDNGRCIQMGAVNLRSISVISKCLSVSLGAAFASLPSCSVQNGLRAKKARRLVRGAALTLCRTGGSVEDVVGCSLRLCGSMNEKLAISAEFLEPACEIGGLIANDPV